MTAKKWVAQLMVVGLAIALTAVPEFAAAQESTQSQPATQKADPAPAQQDPVPDSGTPNQKASPDAAPDSPGAVKIQSEQSTPGSNSTAGQSNAPVQPSPQTPAKPLGTAAAQPLTPSGVAASQPAGAAVAPARQKRSRSLLIKVGVVVGAAVAVGTVVALSTATSSRPPGAH